MALNTRAGLGANSILSISMACTRASAASNNIELFELIRSLYDSEKIIINSKSNV